MLDSVTITLSVLKDKLKNIDSELILLQENKKKLESVISNWDMIVSIGAKADDAPRKIYIKEWSCPHCDYTCDKELGLRQHVTHFHEPKITFKNILSEPPVVCLEDGCGREFKNNAGLMIHVAAAHRESTSLPPKPEKIIKFTTKVKPITVEGLKQKIVTCANPQCSHRLRFVEGTGIVINGVEFCNRRCHMEWEKGS